MHNPVVRFGLIYGFIGALLEIGAQTWLGLTNIGQVFGGAAIILRTSVYVVGAVLYLLAGRAATAQTGKVSSGLVAGLLAGLTAGLVGNIFALMFFSPVGKVPYDLLIQALVIVASLEFLALDVGLGAGAGALGGMLGRGRAQRR